MNKWSFALLLFLIACTSSKLPAVISTPESEPTVPVVPTLAPKVSTEPPTPESCLALGCLRGTQVVGDVKSDIFYECNCTFAKWIKPEDMLCFASVSAAIERGYRQAKSC